MKGQCFPVLSVLNGFAIVVIIIALGFGVGRKQWLGPNAVYTLNMFVFWIALPATLIRFMMHTDLKPLFGVNLAVVALSTTLAGALGFTGYHLIRRLQGRANVSDSIVAMLACTYCNSTNLGIPLATHLLSDATLTLPVILFQIGLYGPASVLLLDMHKARSGAASEEDTGGHGAEPNAPTPNNPARSTPAQARRSRTLLRDTVLTIVRNPLIFASAAGIALALIKGRWGWELPSLIAEPIEILSGCSIGAALIAFGMSMADVKILQKGICPRRSVFGAALVKTVAHPLIAVGLGAVLFSADRELLLTIALIAALPTGQNVFIYAQRFGANKVMARDTAVLSTALALPSMTAIMLLLGG